MAHELHELPRIIKRISPQITQIYTDFNREETRRDAKKV